MLHVRFVQCTLYYVWFTLCYVCAHCVTCAICAVHIVLHMTKDFFGFMAVIYEPLLITFKSNTIVKCLNQVDTTKLLQNFEKKVSYLSLGAG